MAKTDHRLNRKLRIRKKVAGTTERPRLSIYKSLNTQLIMETKKTEITAFFSAAAVILAVIAAGLSLIWFNRIL